jgi:hypothetical protein
MRFKRHGDRDLDQGQADHTNLLKASVRMFHAATLANGQTATGGLQGLLARLLFLTGRQALGGVVVRAGHGLMAGNIDRPFFLVMGIRRYRNSIGLRSQKKG